MMESPQESVRKAAKLIKEELIGFQVDQVNLGQPQDFSFSAVTLKLEALLPLLCLFLRTLLGVSPFFPFFVIALSKNETA